MASTDDVRREPAPPADRPRVLVVDDEHDFAESLVDVLSSFGYEAATAHAAAEALSRVDSFRPDAVLVDIRLGMDAGTDLVAALSARTPPVASILMTAYASVESAVEALQRGAWDYLRKPFEATELDVTLRRCLERVRLTRERDAAERDLLGRNRELEDVNWRLRAMVNASRLLTSCKEVEDLGRNLLSEFCYLMSADGGSVYLRQRDGLRLLSFRGQETIPFFLPFPLPEGSVFDRAMRGRESLWIQDVRAEQGLLPVGGDAYRDGSIVVFPLVGEEGVVLGVLSLHNKRTPPFTPQDKDLGAVMASLAAEILDRQRAAEAARTSEAHLSRMQRLEAIGTLAGGIAHDFNNILSAILGYGGLALAEAPAGTPLRENLEVILEAAGRAAELTRQILAFGRPSQREIFPIEFRSVVAEAVRLVRATFPSTIVVRQLLDSAAAVVADPGQMHQVLMNLCTNARLSFQDRSTGHIDILLDDEDLDASFSARYPDVMPGRYIRLRVRDDGSGMTPEVMERIFEPFYTTRSHGEGSGMGLAMVHGIVRNHGGVILVESVPGSGTTFTIYLPVIDREGVCLEKEAAEESEGREPVPEGTERILFVDDEPMQVKLGQEVLGRLGYRVTAVDSSEEAFARFRETPDAYDLVITDMTMPGMTGDVLAREILKIRPGMAVILCTGYSERITEREARALGIREYVMKPCPPRVMAGIVRRVLDRG
jgi:signal transduction histidine kinase